jgi:hypothetical protein
MRRIGGGCRLKLCGSYNAFCTYERDVKLVITFREAVNSRSSTVPQLNAKTRTGETG